MAELSAPRPHLLRWTLQLEIASGVAPRDFGNTLFGGRVDFGFGPKVALGGYLGLANLKGKDARVTVLLPCAVLSYESPRPAGRSLSFPLQFSTGYLARNGPVARISLGLAWAVGRRTDLVFSLAPMVWTTHDQLLLSLNLGLELRFAR